MQCKIGSVYGYWDQHRSAADGKEKLQRSPLSGGTNAYELADLRFDGASTICLLLSAHDSLRIMRQ